MKRLIVGVMIAMMLVVNALTALAAPKWPPRYCQTHYKDQIRPPRVWNGLYSNSLTPAACRGVR